MSAISNFLSFLRSAIYAIDVRDGIADAIEQCYNDVNNPTLKTEALEAALQNKIDQGKMAALTIGDHTITAAKLASGVIDNTLATSGAAADAKTVGDELGAINESLGNVRADLSTQTGVISLIKDYYIKTSDTPINLTPISSSVGRMYAVVDCTAGDEFIINAYSDFIDARTWCFIDSSNNAISMSDANAEVTDLELTAPENAVKLIINDKSGGMSYKVGNNIVSKIDELEKGGIGLTDAAKEALLACFRNVVWRDTSLGQNLYNSLVSALEVHDVIAFGDLTQFEIGQRGFTRTSGTYINRTLPAWCACDISFLNFNVGDKIKLIGALKNTYIFKVGSRDANATVTAKAFIKENTSDDLVLEASNITDAKAIEVRRQDSANLTNQDIDVISNGIVWEKSGEDIYHTYKFEYPSTLLKASGQIELLDSPYGLKHTSNAGRRTIYMGYGKIPYASEASGNPLVAEYPIPIPDDAVRVKVSITPNTQYVYLGLLLWDSANNKYTRPHGWAWAQGVSNADLSSYMSKNRSLFVNTKYNEAGTSYPAEPTKVVVEFTKGESNE